MANRIAALIGPGIGPWVQTHMLDKLRVRITGLREGVVKVLTEEAEHFFSADGVYEIQDSPRCMAAYDGTDANMICTFIGGGRSAV